MADKQLKFQRTTFETSRALEYFTERELSYQTGHNKSYWPLVILKELMDNALDACENASIAPEIEVGLLDKGQFFSISVEDNGPGIPPDVVSKILNYTTRTSDKEAYVSPTRGAQGNALKTVFAIPYVLSTQIPPEGVCEVESRGVKHIIKVKLDVIKQEPKIDHDQVEIVKTPGCRITVWLNKACIIGAFEKGRFLQLLWDYYLFNPHLSLAVKTEFEDTNRARIPQIEGEDAEKVREALLAGYQDVDRHLNANLLQIEEQLKEAKATKPNWQKWKPNDFTSPLWYSEDDLKKLILSHVALAQDGGGRDLTLREFVSQFRGITATAKQKLVTSALPEIKRLSDFTTNGDADSSLIGRLLSNMKSVVKAVPPQNLGIIGEEHFKKVFEGRDMKYVRKMGSQGNIPFVVEVAYIPDATLEQCKFHFGLNFAPASSDPLQDCGLVHETKTEDFEGQGIVGLARRYKVDSLDKIHVICHIAYPRFRFKDRGKTILEVENE